MKYEIGGIQAWKHQIASRVFGLILIFRREFMAIFVIERPVTKMLQRKCDFHIFKVIEQHEIILVVSLPVQN